MEKEDYLMRQINMMARALGSILAKFIGTASNDSNEEAINELNNVLISEINLPLNDLIELPNNKLLEALDSKGLLSEKIIELIAAILYQFSINNNKSAQKHSTLKTSLFLYNHLQDNSLTYSIEWSLKTKEITKILSNLTSQNQ